MFKKAILTLIVVFVSNISFGQATKKFDNSGTVDEQFDYLITKSNRYQQYKVVQLDWLQQLQRNVLDTIAQTDAIIKAKDAEIQTQNTEINNLNTSLNTANTKIEELSTQIESISLFGMQLKKPVFKSLMFTIIGILALLLAIFIFQFKRSNAVTTQTKADIKELEEEFDQHRKRALEREQKVMRRLQDELNKQKKDK